MTDLFHVLAAVVLGRGRYHHRAKGNPQIFHETEKSQGKLMHICASHAAQGNTKYTFAIASCFLSLCNCTVSCPCKACRIKQPY